MCHVSRSRARNGSATYVADPFLARDRDTWHMFFEVYNWRANKGEIAVATSDRGDRWHYRGIVLAEDFHLSYPYVFEHDGEWWMVPETVQAHEVRLYRARSFPHGWTHVATLLEGEELLDSSLFRHGGRWWLLAAGRTRRDDDTLRLYHAARLDGAWREHPQSPVIAGDPARARPAGRAPARTGGDAPRSGGRRRRRDPRPRGGPGRNVPERGRHLPSSGRDEPPGVLQIPGRRESRRVRAPRRRRVRSARVPDAPAT